MKREDAKVEIIFIRSVSTGNNPISRDKYKFWYIKLVQLLFSGRVLIINLRLKTRNARPFTFTQGSFSPFPSLQSTHFTFLNAQYFCLSMFPNFIHPKIDNSSVGNAEMAGNSYKTTVFVLRQIPRRKRTPKPSDSSPREGQEALNKVILTPGDIGMGNCVSHTNYDKMSSPWRMLVEMWILGIVCQSISKIVCRSVSCGKSSDFFRSKFWHFWQLLFLQSSNLFGGKSREYQRQICHIWQLIFDCCYFYNLVAFYTGKSSDFLTPHLTAVIFTI